MPNNTKHAEVLAEQHEPGRTTLTVGLGRTLKVVPAQVEGQDGVAIDVVRNEPGQARRLVVTLYFTRTQFLGLMTAGLDSLVEGIVGSRVKESDQA